MTDPFSRTIAISTMAHGLLAIMIFVKAVLVPATPIDLRPAIRVDIVGLPQKMTEPVVLEPPALGPAPAPQPVAEPAPAPKPVPKAPTVPKKPDLKEAQRRALSELKRREALQNITKQVTANKPAAKPGTKVAGNQISEGNSLRGLQRLNFDRYTDDLRVRIHGNWNVPQWLAESNYRAQIKVLIDEQGYVMNKIFLIKSGNEVFDATVVDAIDASSPVPPPPPSLKAVLATGGIVLNFPE